MLMNPFARRDNPHALVVGMTGVKMGDRLLQVGCADGRRLGVVSAKVGLSGRAVAVVTDEAAAERARKGAAREGVLVEVDISPATRLAYEDGAFDVAVVDDTGGAMGLLPAADRAAAFAELLRALRPAGRVIVIGAAPRTGLTALVSSARHTSSYAVSGAATAELTAGGFKSVRTLADREGLVFVEGIKPRQ